MADTVIRVENLGKRYRIGSGDTGYKTFRETLVDSALAPFQRLGAAWSMAHRAWSKNKSSALPAPGSMLSSQSDDLFWALKDVSFEVKQGEVVGIVGRNGAGKSTLLKILSKITEPTEGRIELKGRVGSLLEVGTGFHPELTGHENVYLYGAILGMDRWEITRKFDEIIAFAELEKFVDTPVKRYSSGMYMRLAFAVAAHLEPEILLVDEVLAVGDAQFQKKCLGKMEDVSKEGRTVLFVSHNMTAILSLCERSILLDSGRVISDKKSNDTIGDYLDTIDKFSTASLAIRQDRKGNRSLEFLDFTLLDSKRQPINYAYPGQNIIMAFDYKLNTQQSLIKSLQVDIGIHGRFEENLFHLSTQTAGFIFKEIPPVGTIFCHINNVPLQPGKYSFNLFSKVSGEISDWIQNAGIIEIETSDFFGTGKLSPLEQGSFLVKHSWSLAEGKINETHLQQ